jgi:tetratricopeptide (TPR) repeat protein
VGVFVKVNARQGGQIGGFFAEIGQQVYTLIVTRTLKTGYLAVAFLTGVLGAQTPPSQNKQVPPPAAKEQEPPEEDESLIPKEYALNPLESGRNITAGNFYFKKGNYRAAVKRYLEASRWDPGSADAFFKLAEANERLKDHAAARDAYEKYLAISPDAKNADSIKKKIAKWPKQQVANK